MYDTDFFVAGHLHIPPSLQFLRVAHRPGSPPCSMLLQCPQPSSARPRAPLASRGEVTQPAAARGRASARIKMWKPAQKVMMITRPTGMTSNPHQTLLIRDEFVEIPAPTPTQHAQALSDNYSRRPFNHSHYRGCLACSLKRSGSGRVTTRYQDLGRWY